MIIEPKVNLSIVIPGRTMYSQEECTRTIRQTKEKKLKSGKTKKITVDIKIDDWDMMDSHIIKIYDNKNYKDEVLNIHTRKYKPAIHCMNINKEAYEYMRSASNIPYWVSPFKWKSMSKKERLESHFHKLMENFNGISYSYEVFED